MTTKFRVAIAALITGVVLALTLPALGVVYNYFSPGGALSGNATSQNVNLAAGSPFIAGTLPAGNGGTGAATLTAHGVLLGQGSGAITAVSAMAADTLLQGKGASADPAAVSLVNCGSSTQALAYSTASHAFSCQTITTSGGPSVAAKPSDTARTSTTTVTDDPDLQFTSQGAGTYSVEWLVTVTGPTTTANFKVGLNCTGTVTTSFWSALNRDQTGTTLGNAPQNACNASTTFQTVTLSTAAGNYLVAQGYGYAVTSTTGTISIQWAQGTSNGNPVTVKQGSWMRIQKIL